MPSLAYVAGDDWQAIYIDGVLVREDHRIDARNLIYIINEYMPLKEFKVIDADYDWLDDWLEKYGRFPAYLKDVKT